MTSLLNRLAVHFGLRDDPTPPPAGELASPGTGNEEHDLGALLANAPPVPLTDEVRVEPREFATRLMWEMDRAEGTEASRKAAAGLQALVDDAKPIPLTDQVRIDGRKARDLLAELRGEDTR